jgi:uncharacterized DUF497 family protein
MKLAGLIADCVGFEWDEGDLFVVFTIRKELVRPISARDMNRKERKVYESS